MATLKVTNIKNESFAGDQLYLKTDGKIGIGTATPDKEFHLERNDTSTSAIAKFKNAGTGDTTLQIGTAATNFVIGMDNSDGDKFKLGYGSVLESMTGMTIDSSGKVGIGTTSPVDYYSPDLVVKPSGSGGITIHTPSANTGYLMFADGSTGTDRYAGYIGYGHSSDTFYIRGSGAGDKGIDIESDGDLKINDGNLVVASGHGIDFYNYGTGVDSNLLDDYEEGTFTPVWTGQTTAGTVNYGLNMARYIKIGNVVQCNGYTQISSVNSTSGNWIMNNLPFTNTGIGTTSPYETGSCMLNHFDFPAAMDDASAWVVTYKPANNTNMYLYYSIDGGAWAPLQAGHDATWDIIWSLSYKVG